jgi:uncharacterized protein YecT (DUF1311 family)
LTFVDNFLPLQYPMNRESWLKELFALVLLTTGATEAFAATAAEQFGAHRWPTEPKLSVDLQKDLCKQILTDAVEAFASVDTDLDIAAAIARDFPPLATKAAIDGAADDTPSPLGRLDLDLDGTGHQQVVIYRDNSFNWRGEWHYAYVFPSAADFDSAKTQIASTWLTVPQDSQYPPPGKREYSAQQYYPSALTNKDEEIQTGDVWADHALFEANKRFYFAGGTTAFDREAPAPVQIFRLLANGYVEIACKIESGTVDEAYKTFQKLPAMGALLATIRTIGAGGEDGGTMHSGQMHDAQATAAEIRAAYRPWATSAETKPGYSGDNPYYRFDERTRAFLEDWSLEELWNRREYQTLMELTGPAEASYANYLESAFDVTADAARLDAIKVIQALIGARLEVPNQFTTAQTRLYFPSTPLHQAVMRRDRVAFDAALANPQSTADQAFGRPPKPTPEILSDALPDAVEWPYGLDRLLAAGADPNHTNAFGKTPLMVAAHFDRPDSVTRLLKAGAKVDALTTSGSVTLMEAPKRAGRTALMYAAENASPAAIKALLDAGADPSAHDSAGNDMGFYLANNPRFTAPERALGVTGLAKIAEQFSGPSFSCEKARSSTEHAICGSDVLRIFDAQISRAFTNLLSNERQVTLSEQRAWLRERDRSCGGDQDCLAEMMRTHLRYLHERAAEAATPTAQQR